MDGAWRWSRVVAGDSRKVNLNALVQRLKDEGISVQLSNDAYFGEPRAHGFKVGYAFLNQSNMEEAIHKAAREIRRQMDV